MASDDRREPASIVLDSSFLIGFHNEGDAHHAAAVGVMQRLLEGEWETVLLPEYVVVEVLTVLTLRADPPTAVEVGDVLLRSRQLQFVPCSDIFLAAFEIFRAEESIALSFVDAAIIAVAREYGASSIATFDSDFQGIDDLILVPAGATPPRRPATNRENHPS